MTPTQVDLARHALGLPNARRRSYRNHYVTGPGGQDYVEWSLMVVAGWAWRSPPSQLTGGDDCFGLTLTGANLALQGREKLDPEDFPALKTKAGQPHPA